jgi:phosphoribosylformimino-5-aminoimidazole carboxamide ribotide isomerase
MPRIVPVIDLLRGQVGPARRGERQSYRPIISDLCTGSDPLVVARALIARTAAREL